MQPKVRDSGLVNVSLRNLNVIQSLGSQDACDTLSHTGRLWYVIRNNAVPTGILDV
jgi:hypothetical protein